jgi:hypothetical protein
VAVFYPRKKLTNFDRAGRLETESTSTGVDIVYGDRILRKLIIEDWNSESLAGRDFSLSVEINEEFIIYPVLNLEVSDDGYGDEGELHFFLERIRVPVAGSHLPPSGGGLFERGLAIQGIVNPGTVRYSVQCEDCFGGFTFRAYHAGMSEIEYFYCDKSSQPLAISIYDPLMDFKRPGVGSKPDEFTPADIASARERIRQIEARLIKSDAGGDFQWLAPFRCPHCSHPLIDFRNNLFRKAWEYYVCCHKGQVMREFSSPPDDETTGEEKGDKG